MKSIFRSQNHSIRKIKLFTTFQRFAKIWDSFRKEAKSKICNIKKCKKWRRELDNDQSIILLFKIQFLTTSNKSEQIKYKNNCKILLN
jgi:hypothetical protein